MRRRRSPAPALTLLAALTATACDSDPGEKVVQRDVYSGPHALENCVADWGNEELCKKQLDDAEKKQLAASSPHTGGGIAPSIFVWGPGYSGSDRAVSHNGQTITPATQRAVQTAAFARGVTPAGSAVRPVAFNMPKPAGVSSGFTSRGGFGATGRAVGGGSS